MPAAMLVCPACRTRDEHGIHLRTLEPGPDGLACECGRRYPVVDGIPIVLAEPRAFYQGELPALLEGDLPPAVAQLLLEAGPDDAPLVRLHEHVSTYLDAHWGDRADPPPDGPAPTCAIAPLAELVAARGEHRVAHAVELGCSAGRVLAALAAGAERTVGLELQLATLRRARRILAGERLAFLRRQIGRHYAPARIAIGPLPRGADRVELVCGDALDPPLIHGWFDRVVAFNLLDSVPSPRQLLSVIDSLCAPGGEILLACPYQWQSNVLDDGERLGGTDPAGHVAEILRTGAGLAATYVIEDEAEVAWTLRRDSRSAVTYRTHYLRARKGNEPPAQTV